MSASEWIGFGVGVCLMGLLVSSLLVISGRSAGVPRSKVVRAMLTIWGAMAACVAGLLFVRQQTGGDAATRAPWRIAVAYLHALLEPEDFPADLCFAGFCPGEAGFIRQQIEKGLNVPRTTSMGRLFDAVSALLGVRSEISYEAQAAMELEQLAWGAQDWRPFPFAIEDGVVRLAPLFYALLETLERGVALPDPLTSASRPRRTSPWCRSELPHSSG